MGVITESVSKRGAGASGREGGFLGQAPGARGPRGTRLPSCTEWGAPCPLTGWTGWAAAGKETPQLPSWHVAHTQVPPLSAARHMPGPTEARTPRREHSSAWSTLSDLETRSVLLFKWGDSSLGIKEVWYVLNVCTS